jgi:hypothetical protein
MFSIIKAVLSRVLDFLIDEFARRVADTIVNWLDGRIRIVTPI